MNQIYTQNSLKLNIRFKWQNYEYFFGKNPEEPVRFSSQVSSFNESFDWLIGTTYNISISGDNLQVSS